ncbi:hypothetical protein D3C71_408320 [compost metagenome]
MGLCCGAACDGAVSLSLEGTARRAGGDGVFRRVVRSRGYRSHALATDLGCFGRDRHSSLSRRRSGAAARPAGSCAGCRAARRWSAQRPSGPAPVLRPHGVPWCVDLVAHFRPRLGQPPPAQPVRHVDQSDAGRSAVVARHIAVTAHPPAVRSRRRASGSGPCGLGITHRLPAVAADRHRYRCHGVAGASPGAAALRLDRLPTAHPRAPARRHPAVRRPALAAAVPGQRR